MKISLRALVLGSNIVLLLSGFLVSYRPMRAILGDVFYNQVVANFVKSEQLDTNSINLLILSTQIDPLNNSAHYLLAVHHFQEGDYLNSIKELETFIEIDPTNSSAYIILGESYWAIGELDLAVEQYKKAAQLDPINLELLQHLPKKYKDAGQLTEQFRALYSIAALSSDPQERLSASIEMSKLSVQMSKELGLTPGLPLGFGRQSSAAVDKNSKLYILARDIAFPKMLVIAVSQDNGKTWGTVRALYVGADLDGGLTIDSTGVVHLVYGDKYGKLIYANSQTDFGSSVVIAESADARQIAVSDDGIVHVVWMDDQHNIWHQEIKHGQLITTAELIAQGRFPSLAVLKDRVFITYNSAVVFPNPSGRVYFIEKEKDKWLPSVPISSDQVWAGASALAIDRDGAPYIVYVKDSKPAPELVFETRNENGEWNILKLNDAYGPYIPNTSVLQFGGRLSPSVTVTSETAFFLWRSSTSESSIVIRMLDLNTGKFSSEKVLGELRNAPFDNSPSFVIFQGSFNSPLVLWTENNRPVFAVPK